MTLNPKQSEKTENIVALSVFAALIIVVVGLFTNGFGLISKEVDMTERINVPIEADPIKGDINSAKVQIIIFSDFECPFCKTGEQTVNNIYQKYTGQVALVFKNFPLTKIHPNAYKAALAAECANEQDKFWEYHDVLFSHNQALSPVDLKVYAKELGLDEKQFETCLDSERYSFNIQQDMQVGASVGVSGTPAFFINGILLSGAKPESEFVKIIDAELAK